MLGLHCYERDFSGCGEWGHSLVAEHGLSSCDAQAELPRGMWDLPGPGNEPVSPALEGGPLTIGPPGKSLQSLLNPGV